MANATVAKERDSKFPHLKGDLVGGLIAAIVALPLALAFGVASGLGAQAGLYGAIACGIFAAMFGGTPAQVSGPTGPMTVVAAGVIAQHTGHPELVFAAVILGGILQIVLGAIRGGTLIHYIPYPVISGFMSGIGCIIILVEIPPLFGLDTPSSAITSVQSFPSIVSQLNPMALAIGLITIAVIYLFPRITRAVPSALVALVGCTLAVVMMNLDVPQISDIGEIPQGIPMPVFPLISFENLLIILPAALSLGLLGAIDSLLTSLVVDKITHRTHDSNKELLGQGLGNIVSGLFGGLPGAGATMRSVVNVNNGGRTNLSGVVHGVILLAVLLGLGGLASKIPLACLAGILITVGIGIIDYRGLKSVGKAAKDDVLAMITVLVLTVFLDLIIAVFVGLSMGAFLFCKRLADLEQSQHGHLDSLEHLADLFAHLPPETRKSTYVYTFVGPLYFGEALNFNRVVSALPAGVKTLVLDFANVPLIDQTGAFTLEDTVNVLKKQGIRLICAGMSGELSRILTRLHVLDKVGADNCYPTAGDALSGLASEPLSSHSHK